MQNASISQFLLKSKKILILDEIEIEGESFNDPQTAAEKIKQVF